MATFTLNLSSSNPALTSLYAARSDKNTVTVTNEILRETAEGTWKLAGLIYHALTGEPLPADDSTISCRFKDGAFKGFYTPYLAKQDGEPVLVWGKTMIKPSSLKPLTFSSALEGVELKTSFTWSDQNGYPEMLLKISAWVEKSETAVLSYFTVKGLSQKETEANIALKITKEKLAEFEIFTERTAAPKGATALVDYLGEPAKPSFTLKLTQLATGVEYKVTGYRNDPDLLTIAPAEEGYFYPVGEDKKVIFDDSLAKPLTSVKEVLQVWQNADIKRTLQARPLIDENNPATLIVTSVYATKQGPLGAKVIFTLSQGSLDSLRSQKEEVPDFDI